MAKRSVTIEEPTVEETPVVVETLVVEETPWQGHPSRDFVSVAQPAVEETPVETPIDGGQE